MCSDRRAKHPLCWVVFLGISFGSFTPVFLQIPQREPVQPIRTLTRHQERQLPSLEDDLRIVPPLWSAGALLGVQLNRSDEPIIWAFNRDGVDERLRFSIPEGRHISIGGVSAGRDGSIAAIGSAYSNDGRGATFLARILPDRGRQIVIRTWPYVAYVVTIAPDEIIWTIGWIRESGPFNVLKRFDRSGNLLTTTALKVRTLHPNPDAAHTSILTTSTDRVGWLTTANEYIEFALDGSELARYETPKADPYDWITTSFALSEHNQAVLSMADREDKSKRRLAVFILNREKRVWEPVEISAQGFQRPERIVGFDGETLVTYRTGGQSSAMARHRIIVKP